MSSKTNNQILSFTRPRSASHEMARSLCPIAYWPEPIQQAFETKCWFFEATIVDSLTH
jgi:hypothetical protein